MLIKFLNGTKKEVATLSRADLSDADLSYANLYRADLSDADLYRADLSDADLSDADLSRANLSDADLSRANLSGANLSGANLSGANLYGAALFGANIAAVTFPEGYRIARLDFGGYTIRVSPETTKIGCQSHKNTLWLKADPRWIDDLAPDATVWWAKHGAAVQAVITDVMAP